MPLFKRSKFILILLLFFEIVVSQTIPSKNITINDGLPSNGIKCFYKDSRGLMWIGTEAGLCCYDGTTYKVYNETNGLKYTQIWSIAEDNDKNIWLSLYGNGLAKFDGKKFTYYDKKDGLINNKIRKMYFSKKHNCLILGTENGLSLFDGKHFKSFIKQTALKHFQIVGIGVVDDKIMITVSYDNVYSINFNANIEKSSLKFEFTPAPSYSSYFSEGNYYCAIEYFSIRNVKTSKEKKYPSPIIWDFTKDENNNVYCAAWNVNNPNGGLFQYSNNKLTNITQQAHITSTGLWCLYYDKETKQLWVGSIDKGIFLVDLSRRIQFLEPSFFGLKELQIQELYRDANNTTWIGAKDKIVLLDNNWKATVINKEVLWDKLRANFKHKKGLNQELVNLLSSNKLKEGFTCFNIISDNEGNIWLNNTIGVFCFDKNYNIRFYRYFDGGHLIFDNKDHAYCAYMYSDMLLMKNKYDWNQQYIFSGNDVQVPRDVTKIIKKGNLIWFASYSKGLFLLQNGVFYSFNDKGLFKENSITDLMINDKGQLVIGANSGSVYITKWDGKNFSILKTYKPYIEIYGTSISFVQQSKGLYYIGTNKGINVVKNDKFFKLINKSEGLQDNQFNNCIKDKNGDLWVATNDGLIHLNVDEFSKSIGTSPTPIRISSIKVNGKSDSKTDLMMRWGSYENKTIQLDYTQNDVEILFSTNNTFNADKNLFRYKVVGLTDTWSDFESNGKIELLGIPNGKYKVLLEGKNSGTGAIFPSKTLDLVITPPFWKTWWFIIGNIIFFSIIVFVIYKKRIHRVEKQERAKAIIQKRLAETKMEALQSQMNPHFIFNAMNSIQNFIIDNKTDNALMYMGEFSKLIRQTLNNSSQQRITLKDEIRYLKSYFALENMRFKNRIKLVLDIDTNLDLFEIEIPPMLIQPFIENVFVHAFDSDSKDPTLTISMKQIKNYLLCEIKDNGYGMAYKNLNKLHTSKGIKLVKERIALFQMKNADTLSISSTSTGTIVVLKLQIALK